QTNSKQGSTNFVIKDAKNDTELAAKNLTASTLPQQILEL
ncbi:hypothetical protein SS7213T_02523, partial [Staphylococcus simiae CCM 7213 = CCUG 51256]